MTPIDVVIDVEADGPTPVLNSMIEIGAVALDLTFTFHAYLKPIDGLDFKPEALEAIGRTREQTEAYPDPATGMHGFVSWLDALATGGKRLVFWSDNPAFDWQYINGYLWRFEKRNPFGHSARRIGDLYAGLKRDKAKHTEWKRLRRTRHTHNALDDAMGNAEALGEILKLLRNP